MSKLLDNSPARAALSPDSEMQLAYEPPTRLEVVVTDRHELLELLATIRQKPGLVTDVTFAGCAGPIVIPPLKGVARLTVKSCPFLTTLRTQPDMVSLQATGQNFSSMLEQPRLTRAYVAQCSLAGLPAMPSVRLLRIRNAALVMLPRLPALEKLELHDCPELRLMPCLPRLSSLELSSCPKLDRIEAMPELQRLFIQDCPKLSTLPELPSLRHLTGWSTTLSHSELGRLSMYDYRRQRLWQTPLPRSRLSMLKSRSPGGGPVRSRA